jgi:DNA-binding MarR family transcriptional regulator
VNSDGLVRELRPLIFRLYYVVRRQTPQLQLTLTQGSVLAGLVRNGPTRMSALADLESVRVPSMTELVARMERLGLVCRESDPDDRRAVLVHVTDEGRRFHDDLIAAREEFLRDRLDALSPTDRDAINSALPALQRLLETGGTQAR